VSLADTQRDLLSLCFPLYLDTQFCRFSGQQPLPQLLLGLPSELLMRAFGDSHY